MEAAFPFFSVPAKSGLNQNHTGSEQTDRPPASESFLFSSSSRSSIACRPAGVAAHPRPKKICYTVRCDGLTCRMILWHSWKQEMQQRINPLRCPAHHAGILRNLHQSHPKCQNTCHRDTNCHCLLCGIQCCVRHCLQISGKSRINDSR